MNFLKKHKHTLLTIGNIVCTIGAVISSSIAMHNVIVKDKKTKKEIIKEYIPTIVLTSGAIAISLSNNNAYKMEKVGTLLMCNTLRQSLKQYEDAVENVYGIDGKKKIDSYICDNIDFDIQSITNVDELPSSTDIRLFYYDGVYFETSIDSVKKAEYHFNRNYVLSGICTINDLRDFLGLPIDNINGNSLGWDACECQLPWIDFNHKLVNIDDDLECIIIYPILEADTL